MSDNSPGRKRAARGEWKEEAPPFSPQTLPFDRQFTPREWRLICLGSIAADMDDHWFIFEEGGWLYFIRSWTGWLMYKVHFDAGPKGAIPEQAFANVAPDQFIGPWPAYHLALLNYLIEFKLLGHDAATAPAFPREG